MCIRDREYTGLIPGETYTVSGILMDKATGEPLLVDGAEVTAEVEFTPESTDGTVELTYALDASTLAGATIVVFETLSLIHIYYTSDSKKGRTRL